jgi:hypothetical protein
VFAPALACVLIEDERLRVVAVLDNAGETLRTRCSALITRTTDGKTLREQRCEIELSPGERREGLALDLSELDRNEALLTVTLGDVHSSRLLGEPKDARLSQPKLSARLVDDGVEITCDVPVIDLFLWTDEPGCRFVDNFRTLSARGSLRFRCSIRPKRLFARSLAGLHPITIAGNAPAGG